MDFVLSPWVLPSANLALNALKNRETIVRAWDKILAITRGKGIKIAIVGGAGVGKTVLLDYLLGETYRDGYVPPGQSSRIERDSHKRNKHRYVFTVVPGQPVHRDRFNNLRDTIAGDKPVDGIIYVVSDGYHELRSIMANDVARQLSLGSLEDLQENRQRAELEDFRRTLELLRISIGKHRRPSWLLLAVNKADLFSDNVENLAAVNKYYLGENSEFRESMNSLLGYVGSDNFMWSSIPVCGWLEDYQFGSSSVGSALLPNQRDAMVVQCLEAIEVLAKGQD